MGVQSGAGIIVGVSGNRKGKFIFHVWNHLMVYGVVFWQ